MPEQRRVGLDFSVGRCHAELNSLVGHPLTKGSTGVGLASRVFRRVLGEVNMGTNPGEVACGESIMKRGKI
jgi:hypothetical protein